MEFTFAASGMFSFAHFLPRLTFLDFNEKLSATWGAKEAGSNENNGV